MNASCCDYQLSCINDLQLEANHTGSHSKSTVCMFCCKPRSLSCLKGRCFACVIFVYAGEELIVFVLRTAAQIDVYLLTTLSFLRFWMISIQAQALLQLQKAVTENSEVFDNSFIILDFVSSCLFPAHRCILVFVFKTHLLWLYVGLEVEYVTIRFG